jgi:hypothetical protein
LDEDGLGACGGEFGGEVGELGQDFVHDADLGSEAVRVDVFCEEAANVACWKEFKCQWRSSRQAAPCVLRRGRKTALGVRLIAYLGHRR